MPTIGGVAKATCYRTNRRFNVSVHRDDTERTAEGIVQMSHKATQCGYLPQATFLSRLASVQRVTITQAIVAVIEVYQEASFDKFVLSRDQHHHRPTRVLRRETFSKTRTFSAIRDRFDVLQTALDAPVEIVSLIG